MRLLRELELQDDNQDLFLVGYLIPQVDLAAYEAIDDDAFAEAFRSRVRQSVIEDGLSEQDCQEIERLLVQVETRLQQPDASLS